VYDIQQIAIASLYLYIHHQLTEPILQLEILQFYQICTGVKYTSIPEYLTTVLNYICVELDLKPFTLIDLIRRYLTICQRDIMITAKLQWLDGDYKRMNLQLQSVFDQFSSNSQDRLFQYEPRHIATGIIYNSFMRCKMPGTQKYWNAKFIKEHVQFSIPASKITETAAAMKYYINLVCQKTINPKFKS
jgi:hypothetical protein